MIEQREQVATVSFIDDYCQAYRPWFGDVRNFEDFELLHVEMLSEIPRSVRYFQITKGATENLSQADSWLIMSDLAGDILRLPALYTLRT